MQIKPRTRREVAVLIAGGLFIAACLIGSKAVPRWIDMIRLEHDAAISLVSEARRAQAMVTTLESRMDTLEARKARFVALAPSLISEESRAAAEGALASLISGAAMANRVRLGAVQTRPDTVSRTIRTVSARATLVGDVRGVTGFLRELESGPELISIRELSISQPEPDADDERPEALQVELVVEALFMDRAERRRQP